MKWKTRGKLKQNNRCMMSRVASALSRIEKYLFDCEMGTPGYSDQAPECSVELLEHSRLLGERTSAGLRKAKSSNEPTTCRVEPSVASVLTDETSRKRRHRRSHAEAISEYISSSRDEAWHLKARARCDSARVRHDGHYTCTGLKNRDISCGIKHPGERGWTETAPIVELTSNNALQCEEARKSTKEAAQQSKICKERTCAICLMPHYESLHLAEPTMHRLQCGHEFHLHCISECIRRRECRKECVLCMHEIVRAEMDEIVSRCKAHRKDTSYVASQRRLILAVEAVMKESNS